MSRTVMEQVINQLVCDSSLFSTSDTRNLVRLRCVSVPKPGVATTGDDAAAGTDYTDIPIWCNQTGGQVTITNISFTSGATGFTESTSVFATLTITKRTSAGASSTTVGTATTNTVANGGLGTMTTGMVGNFTLTAANCILP